MYRPAWRMNQTGVASAGSSRQALMNRVAGTVSGHLEQRAGEADEIFEPHRLEAELRPELAQLVRHALVEEVVARHDCDRDLALIFESPQASQEAEAVEQRHSEIQDDRVGAPVLGLPQPRFGVHGRMNLVPLEAKHPRKRLRHSLIVIDDEDAR